MKSNKGNVKVAQAYLNSRLVDDRTGDTIDLSGCDAAHIIASFGNGGDTYSSSDKIEVYLQESDDGTNWSTVLAEHVQGVLSGASHTSTFALIDSNTDDQQIYDAHYIGHKSYIRAMIDFTGTHSSGMPLAILAILRGGQYLPIT